MKKLVSYFPFTIYYLLFISSCFANIFDISPGSAGNQFLLVPLSAKSAVLGGFASTGIDCVEKNPASIWGEKPSFQFSHLNYFEDLTLNQAKFLFSVETYSDLWDEERSYWLAAGIRDFSAEDEERDFLTGEKTGDFKISNRAVFLTYAFHRRRETFGITAKTISEDVAEKSSDGFALDFGIISEIKENFSLGFSILNLGSGQGGSDYPSSFGIGANFDDEISVFSLSFEKITGEKRKLTAGFQRRISNFYFRIGGEYQDNLTPKTGFGIELGKFNLDYAFLWHNSLEDIHLFSVNFFFGH